MKINSKLVSVPVFIIILLAENQNMVLGFAHALSACCIINIGFEITELRSIRRTYSGGEKYQTAYKSARWSLAWATIAIAFVGAIYAFSPEYAKLRAGSNWPTYTAYILLIIDMVLGSYLWQLKKNLGI